MKARAWRVRSRLASSTSTEVFILGLFVSFPCSLVSFCPGPTALASTALSWEHQYYTSRGWAWLDVNYGGSSCYGRSYTFAFPPFSTLSPSNDHFAEPCSQESGVSRTLQTASKPPNHSPPRLTMPAPSSAAAAPAGTLSSQRSPSAPRPPRSMPRAHHTTASRTCACSRSSRTSSS